MNGQYILEGHTPVECHDLYEWGKWMQGDHHVADETINGIRISTVFLGLDHAYGSEPPMLFETMTFGEGFDQEMTRCTTWDQAVKMHEDMVQRVKDFQNERHPAE